ncbi:hypothetical protein MPER_04071, partial [Moniliophthora perniciosa FA553]
LDGTIHAGDRAPEAPGLKRLEEKTSVYEVFDATSHTILFFGKSISDIQDSLREKALLDHVFVGGNGHAYENYRVRPGDGFIVVVRPDGYIGAVAKGLPGLKEYFRPAHRLTVNDEGFSIPRI